jgi:hypothetical protein
LFPITLSHLAAKFLLAAIVESVNTLTKAAHDTVLKIRNAARIDLVEVVITHLTTPLYLPI